MSANLWDSWTPEEVRKWSASIHTGDEPEDLPTNIEKAMSALEAFAALLESQKARGPAWAGVNDRLAYEEVHEHSAKFARDGDSKTARMLHTLASRIRQDEEEAKRDVVKEPRPGDRIEYYGDWSEMVYVGPPLTGRGLCDNPSAWGFRCADKSATIIPRREVGR